MEGRAAPFLRPAAVLLCGPRRQSLHDRCGVDGSGMVEGRHHHHERASRRPAEEKSRSVYRGTSLDGRARCHVEGTAPQRKATSRIVRTIRGAMVSKGQIILGQELSFHVYTVEHSDVRRRRSVPAPPRGTRRARGESCDHLRWPDAGRRTSSHVLLASLECTRRTTLAL